MVHTKWWRIAAVAGFGLLAGAASGRAAEEQPPTYVWLFSATGAEAESLTDMVTEEFEEAFGKAGCVPIVERRNLPDLLSHQKQEQRISADFLSPRERRVLSTASADAVVFGKITDDIQGGQIKVAVSLEALSGVKLADTSVRFSRGKRFDAEERERQMAELASKVCSALGFKTKDSGTNGNHDNGPGPGVDNGKGGDDGTGGAEVKKAQGYEFTLKECSPSGSDLECWIMVRNTRERRTLSIMGRSRLIDPNGASHSAELLESDGSWGGSLYIHVDLATGVPGRFGLRFKGLGGYVKEIALLDVDASGFHVEWRDVKVK
jgi:hypothetical protein